MGHVVLLGDSIFDNKAYVPGEPAVIEQVRAYLPADWQATLLAVDGDMAEHVAEQLARLPDDATHLFVSAGGNNALSELKVLDRRCRAVRESLNILQELRLRFQATYRAMLRVVAATKRPAVVCTIYDAIPGLGSAEQCAEALFNEIILREAFAAGLPLIDLRLVCNQAEDYSSISSIEPSATGGRKIARLIAAVATGHDFTQRTSRVYR